jgi:hypothetical protein
MACFSLVASACTSTRTRSAQRVLHEYPTLHVHDPGPHASGLEHSLSVSRRVCFKVHRPYYLRLPLQKHPGSSRVEGVVAQSQEIDYREQVRAGLWCYAPPPRRRVLAVGDDSVQPELAPQRGRECSYRRATRIAYHVPYKQEAKRQVLLPT